MILHIISWYIIALPLAIASMTEGPNSGSPNPIKNLRIQYNTNIMFI